jgi:hypothetical protein
LHSHSLSIQEELFIAAANNICITMSHPAPTKKLRLDYNGPALELKCINTIRAVSADQPEAANSGHPGAPMGCAPMAHLLWGEVMKYSSKDPNWINRDRFVLSNGHACALQYTMLHLTGYDLSIEDLKQFRRLESKTPGHPESFVTDGEYLYCISFIHYPDQGELERPMPMHTKERIRTDCIHSNLPLVSAVSILCAHIVSTPSHANNTHP